MFQIQLKSGTTKILVKGRGANLPPPISSLLATATSVTVQLRGDDAPQCFGITLSEIKKREADFFLAK